MRKVVLGIMLVFAFYTGRAQSEEKLGSWFIYNGFFNVTPKFQLFLESQVRTWETFSNPENFFIRPYFNYNLNKSLQTGLGLEYHKIWTYAENPDNRHTADEYRMTLQVMAFQHIGRVSLQHRYRYEFRNITTGNRQRTRYRIQATIPINKKKPDKGVVFANTFNEFMVDTEPTLNFSQNRFYVAGGYYFTKNLNIQLGYLIISREHTVHRRLQFFLTHKLFFYDRS